MSSSIEAFYDTLAATVFTIGPVTVAVKDADEIPNSVPAANVPVRLLTPLAPFGVEVGAASSVIAVTGGSQPYIVDWTVVDILLWSKIVTDVGVKAHAKDLVAYCVQYLEMLKSLDRPNFILQSVQLTPDVINYPLQSADWFYGVRATLLLTEKYI